MTWVKSPDDGVWGARTPAPYATVLTCVIPRPGHVGHNPATMRHPTLHRWMLRLGLAATMLLVLVPSLGRLAGHGPASTPAPGAPTGHAMHAGHGEAHAPAGTTIPAPTDDHARHADCDYCPLLASLLATALRPVPLLRYRDSNAPGVADIAPRVRWRHPTGLGSRGPPLG